ncbi:hypothetical protein [Glutamicibacter sp. NPDC087344]|uniref:hypothetical protein n=1 Tax=Glutamicibacter sp. NPDC087344 TaxID=3363994 RepID=UPI0037F565D0
MKATNQELLSQLIDLSGLDVTTDRLGKLSYEDFKKAAPWSEDSLATLVAELLKPYVSYDKPDKQWYVWNGQVHSPIEDDASIVVTKGYALELLEGIREDFYEHHKLPKLGEDPTEDEQAALKAVKSQNATTLRPIQKLIARLNGNAGQKSLAEMLSRALPLYREAQKANDAQYITFANGVIDTLAFVAGEPIPEMVPHDSGRRMYRSCPFDFDPKATAPQFKEFIHKSVATEDEGTYLLKALGTAIFHGFGTRSKTIISLQGVTNSGKSMIVDLLKYLFPQHVVAVSGDAVFKYGDSNMKNQDRAVLADARIGFALEVTESLDERFILNYSGGDEYNVKELYKNPIMVKPQGMLIMVSNDGLLLDKTKSQLNRRIGIVEMPHEFSKHDPVYTEDPLLLEKLKGEASGIINILAHGYQLALEQGIDRSEGMEAKLRAETDDEDTLKAYIDESGEVLSNDHGINSKYVGISNLRTAYNKWCAVNGEKSATLNRKMFRIRIERLGYTVIDKTSGGGTVRVSGLMFSFTS